MTAVSPARRQKPLFIALALTFLAILVLIFIWSWDWFVPLVNRRASAALGRPTSIEHLHVHPGFTTRIVVDKLRSEQPAGFEGDGKQPFFTAEHATVDIDLWKLLWHRSLSLPLVALDTPRADIQRRANGSGNYLLGSDQKDSSSSGSSFSPSTIGQLDINDGHIRFQDAKLRANMQVALHTTPPGEKDRGTLVADATGTYAAQPVTGHFVGGALLGLADSGTPYPVDLTVKNGPTRADLKGTIDDPTALRGAKLKLHFAGPDMALLYPLTGVPIPQTPAYDVMGALDYSQKLIRFDNMRGHMGSSDLDGTITVDPHQSVPFVEAVLHSRNVNIADLSGFIGGKPGPQSKTEQQADTHDPNILPDTPINVPKLNAINAHLTYKGEHIENPRLPLDNIDAEFTVKDGAIDLTRLNFAVGKGTLASSASLTPAEHGFATKAKVNFSRIDLMHVIQTTTGTSAQGGIIGGNFTLTSTGNSIASLMANGNGGLTLVLSQGGEVSALLPEILGLQLGKAVLSALGLPQHTHIDCFIADMPLRDGVINTKMLLLETRETRTLGRGTVNFRTNTIDYGLTTRSTGFTALSFPGTFNITGALKSPTVLPDAEIVGRAAASAGLGFVFPALAILPTIQLGVGQGSRCEAAVRDANAHPASGIAPGGRTGPKTARMTPSPAPAHGGKHAAHAKNGHRMTPAEVRAAWKAKMAH